MLINQIPLFPLHVVLFPGMMLPLHIFEERYREMIKACLEGDPRFVVALIREGREVGGRATVHEVGTVARIVSVSSLEDGRMDISVLGVQRARILRVDEQMPFLRADVDLLAHADEDRERLRGAASRVLGLLEQYYARMGIEYEIDPEVAAQPQGLSYVAGVLGLPDERKQRLLEEPSGLRRLSAVERFLTEELQYVERLGPTRIVGSGGGHG